MVEKQAPEQPEVVLDGNAACQGAELWLRPSASCRGYEEIRSLLMEGGRGGILISVEKQCDGAAEANPREALWAPGRLAVIFAWPCSTQYLYS